MKKSTHTLALKSQQWITQALFALVQKKALEEITISELCKKADVSRRTFYRNFEDKQDIVQTYFAILQQEYLSLIKDMTQTDFQSFSLSYFHFWSKHMEFLKAVKKDQLLYTTFVEMLNTFIPTLYPSHLDKLHYDIYFIIGGLHHVLLIWIQSDCKDTPQQIVSNISVMFDTSISFFP